MNKLLIRLNIALCFTCLFSFSSVFSQDINTTADTSNHSSREKGMIDGDDFDSDYFCTLFSKAINQRRDSLKVDTLLANEVLKNAADDQALFMSQQMEATYQGTGKKKTTGNRVKYFGGSTFADEFVYKMPVKRGTELLTYQQVVQDFIFKMLADKKGSVLLADPKFVFYGTGAKLDADGKKAYVSVVFGNYKSFNNGVSRRDEMAVPYSTKIFGLKSADPKICKRCEKFRAVGDLQKGLYVKNNQVYFKYDDLKGFSKLIKDPKDGLAVDIVQKIQYPCEGENILDNNMPSKGVVLKRLYANKLYKKNTITDEKERKKKIDVCLGTLPEDLKGEYELNLLIIQSKRVCRNLSQAFIEKGGVEYANRLNLLADTVTFGQTDYIPKAEKTTLNFRIPFERSKFTYDPQDMDPFLKSLKEPEFIINNLTIDAYSSVEGSDETNKMLQKKRAESIVNALKARQKDKMISNIVTADNMEDFKRDVAGTEYEKMATMTPQQIQDYIRENNLTKKMEPILAKHRYAEINMDVTYDIAGMKEQAFVLSRFNKAVERGDAAQALLIQKYIFKKVIEKKYDAEAVKGQVIPDNAAFAGIMMNKIWLERFVNSDDVDESMCGRIDHLNQLVPANPYILFNKYYCTILNDEIKNDAQIADFQKNINDLYNTTLSKETIDLLNLEFQFKVIKHLDTTETPAPLLTESLDRIKSIVNLEGNNWQNALKLSYIFIKQKDYEFAIKLIEPYIGNKYVFEELVYSYISLCSYFPERLNSNKFVAAMKRANDINHTRYCEMFKGPKFSVQVFENTLVKDDFCKSCNQK
jgi:hypothetical protein